MNTWSSGKDTGGSSIIVNIKSDTTGNIGSNPIVFNMQDECLSVSTLLLLAKDRVRISDSCNKSSQLECDAYEKSVYELQKRG